MATAQNTHLLWIDGLGDHQPGWSASRWAALWPHLPQLTNHNSHEVVWSDVFRYQTGRHLGQVLAAFQELRQEAGGRARLGCYQGSLMELARYLGNAELRHACLRRVADALRPLARPGNRIAVIAHSWGSVLAYEALRAGLARLEPESVLLFTVASPLCFCLVRRRLLGHDHLARLPGVGRWVNLDARGDWVGGSLAGHYPVDAEHLDLEPVGCPGSLLAWSCIHLSYFDPRNVAVLRDILAREVSRAQ